MGPDGPLWGACPLCPRQLRPSGQATPAAWLFPCPLPAQKYSPGPHALLLRGPHPEGRLSPWPSPNWWGSRAHRTADFPGGEAAKTAAECGSSRQPSGKLGPGPWSSVDELGGPGAWGEGSSSQKPPGGHRCRRLREQGPSGAPSGCFLRAPVSPKSPQNPTGGVSVWAAVTLKGFDNHTLRGGQPCPHQEKAGLVLRWLEGQGAGDASAEAPRTPHSPRQRHSARGCLAYLLPHFADVETEAQRRAGIPQKVAQQVSGLWPTHPVTRRLLQQPPTPIPCPTQPGAHSTGLPIPLCLLPTVCLWASHSTSLCLCLLVGGMGP